MTLFYAVMLTIPTLYGRPIPADELEPLQDFHNPVVATPAEPTFVVGCWTLTMADDLTMADAESEIIFGADGRMEVRIGSDTLTADYHYRGSRFSVSGVCHTPKSLTPAMTMLLETLTSEHHVEVQTADAIDIHGRHLLLMMRK